MHRPDGLNRAWVFWLNYDKTESIDLREIGRHVAKDFVCLSARRLLTILAITQNCDHQGSLFVFLIWVTLCAWRGHHWLSVRVSRVRGIWKSSSYTVLRVAT